MHRKIVIQNKSILREEVGYWSGKSVYFNPSDNVVILDSINLDSVIKLSEKYFDLNLYDAIENILNKIEKKHTLFSSKYFKDLKRYISCQHFPSFQDKEFRLGQNGITSPNILVSWQPIASWLIKRYPNNKNKQRDFLISEIVRVTKKEPVNVIRYQKPADVSWLLLGNPSFVKFSNKSKGFSSFIENVILLATLSVPGNKRGDVNWWEKERPEVIAICKKFNLFSGDLSARSYHERILLLSNSAAVLLSLLVIEEIILLPCYWECRKYAKLIYDDWFKLLPDGKNPNNTNLKTFLSRVLVSTTIKTPADIPIGVSKWVENTPYAQHKKMALTPILEAYEEEHHLPKWPLINLDGLRSKKINNVRTWTPEWLEESGYPKKWVSYCKALWGRSGSSTNSIKSLLRFLLLWAYESRGFDSPADILPSDLRNPHNPNDMTTFHKFLVNYDGGNKSTFWQDSARGFKYVTNALLIRQEKNLVIESNPFSNIENPFKEVNRNKTTRKRLPSSIHEAMIDVLLELDENGIPTYGWAKSIGWDWFDQINSKTGIQEKVWCPSRASSLALLLLLPIRRKQARWLDRGLMDSKIWNIKKNKWIDNMHNLSEYRYPSGLSQYERYGRCTGVLQPVSDPFSDDTEIGIFVNTNKTQMWNSNVKTGYEIPWPSGGELLTSENRDVREKSKWLERPYSVIKEQIRWMDNYHPDPEPYSYADVRGDCDYSANDKADLLPRFTPLFSDLLGANFKADNITKIHVPISPHKLTRLYNALAYEVEKRFKEEGISIKLTDYTTKSKRKTRTDYQGYVCVFDMHSLRVAGISRLIEMGVPIHIIQEFIAGHATAVMTLYYKKLTSYHIKMKLLESVDEYGLVGNLDELREYSDESKKYFVGNGIYGRKQLDDAHEYYHGWKMVEGGICPLGGTGCNTGQVFKYESGVAKVIKEEFGQVSGGCGNCRYFMTGPAFLVQQAQASNEIMLQSRAYGRKRNELYKKMNDLNWEDDGNLSVSNQKKSAFNKESIKDEITTIDRKLEDLILEWFNRYKMFEESITLLERWNDFVKEFRELNNSTTTPLVLFSSANESDLKNEIAIRMEKSGDFSLIRNILESAKLRGGLEKASSLAKEQMNQFMNQILRQDNAKFLLLDIKDECIRNEAAFLLAEFASSMVGDDGVQKSLSDYTGISTILEHDENKQWVNLIEQVIGNAKSSISPEQLVSLVSVEKEAVSECLE